MLTIKIINSKMQTQLKFKVLHNFLKESIKIGLNQVLNINGEIMIKINEIQAKTCDISADADHSLTH